MFCQRLLASFAFVALPLGAEAAEITFEENFMGPFGRSAHIHLDGEIRPGDAAKIEDFVNEMRYSQDLRIHVSFHSPGGSLTEGLRIGRYLAELPVTVTTSVKRNMLSPGECASACVFAYLGGDYRYLTSGSKLGIHQFYVKEDADLTVSEGVIISQILASEIVDLIDRSRVKSEFFSLISKVHPEDIFWVPEETLRGLRVVTGAISDQKSEYKQIQGLFYLLLWQQSYYGENKIAAACVSGGGMIFSFFIQPADIRTFNHSDYKFEITINGVAMPLRKAKRSQERDARWAITHVELEPYQLEDLKTAKSFGARHVHAEGVFLGFEYQIEDKKLSEMISGCEAPIMGSGIAANELPAASQQTRSPALLDEPIFLPNIDLTGGDYDNRGVKGAEIERCKEICLKIDSCVGFSWVEKNGWCWPKHIAGRQVQRQGVMSFLIRR